MPHKLCLIMPSVILSFSVTSFAAKAPVAPQVKVGQYAFDSYSTNALKRKCHQVDAALVKSLKSLDCAAAGTRFAGEEAALLTCTDKAEKQQYLIYATAKKCNEARENESANGSDE